MPARRSSSPRLLAAALLVSGCRSESSAPTNQAASSASASSAPTSASASQESALSPLAKLAETPAASGLAAIRALKASLPEGRADAHASYLELCRALAQGAPLWRRPEALGGEVVYGPLRSSDEGGGALLRLDQALVRGDKPAAVREMEAIEQAMRLFQNDAHRIPPSAEVVAQAASLAAYHLGALALQSTQGLPEGALAVLAHLRGTLDFIDAAALAIASTSTKAEGARSASQALTKPLRAQLEGAKTADDLHDLASFVLATGRLGASLRRLASAAGVTARWPYPPRVRVADSDIDEPVSALTLPAERRAPKSEAKHDAAWIELGRRLFFDKRLSKNNARSCATCHVPEKGFADGLARPPSLDPKVTLRHTPTLLYGTLHALQLWDGRALSPERQALGVIHARAEMGRDDAELVDALEHAEDLRPFFAALPDPRVTAENVGRALSAFESSAFVPADAPIDAFARGDERALSADARLGLDVFAGKGRCARCHIPPFFGGSRPTDFAVPVFAALGVPTVPDGKTLDPDRGRALVTKRSMDELAFKTPTVRDVSRTAPYFHHGAFRTLEEVVDFYNKGGGKALGLDVPSQDPEVRPLSLSATEKRALLIFLREALLDRTRPEKLASPR